LFAIIRADVQRFHRADTTPGLRDCLRLASDNFGLQALFVYRFGRWLGSLREHLPGWLVAACLYPIYWLLAAFMRRAYGIRLEQSADIGPGFYIGHFGSIRVARCQIGSRCAIQQHVTLGPETGGPGPVIGTGVWIGAHASIATSICIGDGATIAAGAVVTDDVPPRCLVVGNPGRVIQRDYDNSAFL
jgi:serine O-acetyltransferase